MAGGLLATFALSIALVWLAGSLVAAAAVVSWKLWRLVEPDDRWLAVVLICAWPLAAGWLVWELIGDRRRSRGDLW
jgi:hypothetical protein